MTCPHCNCDFEPTWTANFGSTRTKVTCLHCSKRSFVDLGPLAGLVALWVVLGVSSLAMLIARQLFGMPLCILAPLPVLLLAYPFRELADHKWGSLRPIGELEPPIVAPCAECGSELGVKEMIAHNGLYYCGKCKPILLRKLAEGSSVSAPARPKLPHQVWWFWVCSLLTLLASVLFLAYVLER